MNTATLIAAIIAIATSVASGVIVSTFNRKVDENNQKAIRAQEKLQRQNEYQQDLMKNMLWAIMNLIDFNIEFEESSQKGFNDIIKLCEIDMQKPLNGNMDTPKQKLLKAKDKCRDSMISNAVEASSQ